MNELALQGHVRKAILGEGGFAMKMSHRFLVGVPDLLCVVAATPFFLELKHALVSSSSKQLTLEITPRQASTLRAVARAGMLAGVGSFLSSPHNGLGFRILRIDQFEGKTKLSLPVSDHLWFRRNGLRQAIVAVISDFVADGVPTNDDPE